MIKQTVKMNDRHHHHQGGTKVVLPLSSIKSHNFGHQQQLQNHRKKCLRNDRSHSEGSGQFEKSHQFLGPMQSKKGFHNKNSPAISKSSTVSLPNGVQMPIIGLGTTHSGGYSEETVLYALQNCDYRMIDTAKRYGVEADLGIALKKSGIPREELFLQTKLWPVDFGYAATKEACKASCRNLGVDYLDLYMIHFPEVPNFIAKDAKVVAEETWRAMENLLESGKCRAVGVSNYSEENLNELLEYATVKPHVNQCEFHPYYNPKRLRSYCDQNNILFTGYCPLGKARILGEGPVQKLAKECNKSPAQVCIRWSIEQGVPAIPKSIKKERVLENSEVFDFELSPEQMESLARRHDEKFKCVPLHELQKKYHLPEGYKLKGSIPSAPSCQAGFDQVRQIGQVSAVKRQSYPNVTKFFLPDTE